MKNLIGLLRLVVIGSVFLVLCSSPARASNKVSSPDVTAGQAEFEYRGGFDFGEANSKNHQEVNKFIANYGITDRWRTGASNAFSPTHSNSERKV